MADPLNTDKLRAKVRGNRHDGLAPTSIEAALVEVENLAELVERCAENIDALASDIGEKDDTIIDLKDELEGANERAESALDAYVQDIEAIRQLVATGRTGEALHLFDKVLQDADPECKRLAVVVPRGLPVGGFL